MVDAGGVRHEVCYVGPFASRLGKSAATVRRWERLGILPESPFEQRIRRGPGRRLYTLPWVEGIVAIAESEGLAGRKPACIDATNFTARARELHRELFG
jgi:hypothetical protein